MLEARYKNTGFVNFIFKSISRIAIRLMKYEYFSCFHASQRSRIGAKSGSGAPGPKSAPRRSKSTTFAKGIFQLSNLQKIAMNPIGDPSVLLIQYRGDGMRVFGTGIKARLRECSYSNGVLSFAL